MEAKNTLEGKAGRALGLRAHTEAKHSSRELSIQSQGSCQNQTSRKSSRAKLDEQEDGRSSQVNLHTLTWRPRREQYLNFQHRAEDTNSSCLYGTWQVTNHFHI